MHCSGVGEGAAARTLPVRSAVHSEKMLQRNVRNAAAWGSRCAHMTCHPDSSAWETAEVRGEMPVSSTSLTVASATYLEKFGRPESVDDLANHRAVGWRWITTGALHPFQFVDGQRELSIAMPCSLCVTGTESLRQAVLLGLGLAQMPSFHIAADLKEGSMLRVLADHPVPSAPVSVLYPRNRQLSPRVRLFIDWVALQFAKAEAPH